MPGCPLRGQQPELLAGLVTVAETLDTSAHVVDRLLCAGVEGVRLAGGVQFEQG